MLFESKKLELLEIANRHSFKNFKDEIEKIEEGYRISIAFLGEFKSGKSTIVNCLIGRELLPVAEEPTTHTITEIIGSDRECFKILKNDNDEEEITHSKIGFYIAGDGSKDVQKVILELPENRILKKGFMIVDTPGIYSLEETDERITYGYLPQVDVAFIVVNIEYGTLPASLLKFLKEKVLKEDLSKIFFILNFADLKSQESCNAIKKNVERLLQEEIKISNPIVIAISAKRGIEGLNNTNAWKASNIELLISLIEKEVIKKKEMMVENRVNKLLNEIAIQMKKLLQEMLNSFIITTEELDKKVQDINYKKFEIEQQINKLEEKFSDLRKTTHNMINNIITQYTPLLVDSIINEEDLDEVIKQLSSDYSTLLDSYIKLYSQELFDMIGKITKLQPKVLKESIENSVSTVNIIRKSLVSFFENSFFSNFGGFLGGGGKTLVKESVKASVIKELPKKLLKGIAFFIKELNLLDKFGRQLEKPIQEENVKNTIYSHLISKFEQIMNIVKSYSDSKINKLLIPLKELEKSLNEVKIQRKEAFQMQVEIKSKLKEDLEIINKIINKGGK